jgi:hypothetical protein
LECDPIRVDQAIRRSDLRSLDSAIQSRVGDGFLVMALRWSASSKRNPVRVARLPEHEVRGECEGPKPAVDDNVPQPGPQR